MKWRSQEQGGFDDELECRRTSCRKKRHAIDESNGVSERVNSFQRSKGSMYNIDKRDMHADISRLAEEDYTGLEQ